MFKEDIDQNSVTTKCTISWGFFDEKQIFIVDTHDFLDTTVTDEAMRSEVASIVSNDTNVWSIFFSISY